MNKVGYHSFFITIPGKMSASTHHGAPPAISCYRLLPPATVMLMRREK